MTWLPSQAVTTQIRSRLGTYATSLVSHPALLLLHAKHRLGCFYFRAVTACWGVGKTKRDGPRRSRLF